MLTAAQREAVHGEILKIERPPVATNGHNKLETSVVCESFAGIQAVAIEWMWPQRIPKGKLTIFSGPPDAGKTTAAMTVVARYTTGAEWPDGAPNTTPPGDALLMISEDDPGDTIKPRLMAAGADIARVHLLRCIRTSQGGRHQDRMLALDTDLALLEAELRRRPNVGLVEIDPLSSYIGKAKINDDQELRRVLVPVKELCERTQVTMLGLGHFNKRSDVNALQRVGGAVAMAGVPRAVWLFVPNPEVDGERLMLLGKGNLTRKRTGLRYRIVEQSVTLATGPTGVPIIDWLGDAQSDAESVLQTASNPTEKKAAKAEHFLRDFLATGARSSDEIMTEGKNFNIGRSTLFEAKRELGIRAVKTGTSWFWELPSVQESGDLQ